MYACHVVRSLLVFCNFIGLQAQGAQLAGVGGTSAGDQSPSPLGHWVGTLVGKGQGIKRMWSRGVHGQSKLSLYSFSGVG